MESLLSHHFKDVLLKLNNDTKTVAKYCDITLFVDEREYPVHKCIFGIISSFFDKMFTVKMKEQRENQATIEGITPPVFEVILDFIYTGTIDLSMENVYSVIEATHFLDLPYIQELCISFLSAHITAENWSSILAYGKRYGYDDLVQKVNNSLAQKFDTMVTAGDLIELEIDELQYLLSLENKNVRSQEKLYQAIIDWLNIDIIGREKFVDQLMEFVEFSSMSLEFLNHVVAKEKLMESSLSCSKAILRAIGNKKQTLFATSSQPLMSRSSAPVLPLSNFVAVDSKSVFKWNSKDMDLKKQMLQYDHSGGSAVKVQMMVIVAGGYKTRKTEAVSIDLMRPPNAWFYHSTMYHRYGGAAVSVNGTIYLSGGLSTEKTSEYAEKLKRDHGWDLISQMNFDRHGHALVAISQMIYAVGGSCTVDKSLMSFGLGDQKLKTLPSMKTRRMGLAAVVFNEEIYAIGGTANGSLLRTVEKYHPLMEKWSNVASLKVGRHRPAVCVLHGHIVVLGGGSSAVEMYNEEENVWIIVAQCDDLKNVFAMFKF